MYYIIGLYEAYMFHVYVVHIYRESEIFIYSKRGRIRQVVLYKVSVACCSCLRPVRLLRVWVSKGLTQADS